VFLIDVKQGAIRVSWRKAAFQLMHFLVDMQATRNYLLQQVAAFLAYLYGFAALGRMCQSALRFLSSWYFGFVVFSQ
jgi:hypothetical protein